MIEQLIQRFDLQPHPEGGFYKEVFRSKGGLEFKDEDQGLFGYRNYLTGIYFLLTSKSFSAFHRIKQDESWHFYEGNKMTIYVISPTGELTEHKLGRSLEEKCEFQVTIPANNWFAARVDDPEGFSFVGCNVAPGFDFSDFELAERSVLVAQFPQHEKLIEELTRI